MSAASGTDAWAVGWAFRLILHWNGRAWSRVTGLNPGPVPPSLQAVKVISAASAWAVGNYCTAHCEDEELATFSTLILHWNGRTWSKVPSPVLSSSGTELNGVTATSGTSAWAVGRYIRGTAILTLILHWNGRAWSRVASPSPSDSYLDGVTATSGTSAWAVGQYCPAHCDGFSTTSGTLILHWNGKTWSRVASPSPSESYLDGVTATSGTSAWAVGGYCPTASCAGIPMVSGTLILHWNGKTWSRVASPSPGSNVNLGSFLDGVTATSGTSAWAVGGYYDCTAPSCSFQMTFGTLILHWNGRTWSRVAIPSPGSSTNGTFPNAVTATSSTSAWTVGGYIRGAASLTLILHWNGRTWSLRS